MSTSDFHPSVRTVLASFLFVDIVGFSKVPAAQQHAFKAGLITVLHRHLAALHRSDYRLRDTGDGALISFLANPEHALYTALAIAQDLGAAVQGADLSLKDLRTGINLGAVKESFDVEQRPNYVGDGINAAQRIMDFAQPGQITASRSFMEAVAHLDATYAALFQHLGARADKHGREHELFSVAPSEPVLAKLREEISAAGPEIVEVDFDLDRMAPPSILGLPPSPAPKAGGAAAWFKRQWVLGLIALVLVTGLAVLIARMLESHEPAAMPSSTTPATLPAPMPVPVEPSKDAAKEAAPPAAATSAALPAPAATTPASAPAAVPEPAIATPAAPASAAVAAPPTAPAATPPTPARETAPSRTARKTIDNPRQQPAASTEAPVQAPAPAMSERSKLRCSQIMQKAGVGEPLSPEEKKELANSCR